MTDIDVLSDTIAAIYDAAVDPGLWPVALELTARLLGGRTASIGISDAVTRETLIRTTFGVHEPYASNYAEYVASMPFYRLYAAMGVEEAKAGSSMYDMDEFLASTFYREWAKPQGLMDVAALCIMNDDRRFGIFGVNTGDERPLVGEADLETLRLLAPHLRRAATISDLLDVSALTSARLDAALDTFATGIVLVDDDLRVLHANDAARRHLDDGAAITTRTGHLSARAPETARSLEEAVRRAAVSDQAIGRSGFGLPARRDGEGRASVLHVLPARHTEARRDRLPSATAAVFVTTPDVSPTAPVDALAALYDLSRAEAQVFALVGQGIGATEAARRLGISPATAKSHVLSIYRKTGLSRLPQIVSLVGSLSVALGAGR
jgi:DNA-binding CsgD family transcriptional regulator